MKHDISHYQELKEPPLTAGEIACIVFAAVLIVYQIVEGLV